jgi:hypothetical protein
MITNKHGLSHAEKCRLRKSILDYKAWLCKINKLNPEAAARYRTISFPRPTSADWTMVAKDSEVLFNTYIAGKCSLEFFRMVALHECFHLFVQGVPNKSDAKRLKDDFGDSFMQLLDIEADYYTAMYYKEVDHASLVDVFTLFYQGSNVFGDPDIRLPKLERFVGSVLSIANAYFENPGVRQTTKHNELFLPALSNILTEERIHTFILRRNHFAVGSIQANTVDFANLKKCYTGSDGRSAREYIETLIQFAGKALGKEVPAVIYSQLYRKPVVVPSSRTAAA